MADNKKYKVWNKNKFDVGIRLMNNIEVNIKPNSFYLIDEDNIYYLNTICGLFRGNSLIIEDDKINADLDISSKNFDIISDKEIEDLLEGNFEVMKIKFDKIDKPHIKYRIFSVAKNMYDDLSGRQLKYLAKLCNKETEDFVSENKSEKNEGKEDKNILLSGKTEINDKDEIVGLLKGNFMKMKSELGKYKKKKDKEIIFEIASEMAGNLSDGKVRYISELCGKELVIAKL